MRYLAVIVCLAISACSTPMEREFNSFKGDLVSYQKSISDGKGKVTVPDSVFYNETLAIAIHHKQSGYEKVFRMLKFEAIKKQIGVPNRFDELEKKLTNKDQSMFDDAEVYEVNMNARDKCNEFGYKENTPDFNKCVYDYKLKYISLQIQQQQLMMQMMPPPTPLIIPKQTHTDCNPTWGGGFSCTTK